MTEGLEARRAIELGVAARTVGRSHAGAARRVPRGGRGHHARPTTAFDIATHLGSTARFHEYFVGLAGSPALVDAHRRVNTAAMIMSVTGERAIGEDGYQVAAESAYRHHVRLLEAYESGRPDGARST